MASAAQIEANRLNAALSTGPATSTGKARSSRNHLKFGLFSTQNCVRPEETAEYTRLSKALWKDLNPIGPVEQMLAVEIVRAAWRLQRCAVAEAEDGENPTTQAAVDRARASAHNSLRRLLNDLRQFQSDRWLRAEVLRDGFDEAYYGIADAHRVIKGLTDNERLKGVSLIAQVGQALSPGSVPAPTNRTQSTPGGAGLQPAPGFSPAPPAEVDQPLTVSAAGPEPSPTNRTQSAPGGAGLQPAPGFSPAPAEVGQPLTVSAAGPEPSPTNRTQCDPALNRSRDREGAVQPRAAQSPAPDPRSLTPDRVVPRNAPCPCQSGLKYKRCCGPGAPPVLTTPLGRHHQPPL